MKKIYLFILAITFGSLSKSSAQVAMVNNLPPFGTTVTWYSVSGSIANASGGADQIWDYNSKTGSAITGYTVVDPATLPSNIKDSVPTATFGNQFGGPSPALDAYDFYSDKTTCYVKVGKKNSGNGAVEKTNDTTIVFNMAYGSTLAYGKLNNTPRKNKYDGYGTLKIAGSTYSNVVKITSWIAGTMDTLIQFHQFTPHYQLLMSYAIIGGNIQSVLYWKENPASGIDENPLSNSFKLSPNPNAGVFTITLPESNSKATVLITSVVGEVIYNKQLNEINSMIDISSVSAGIYMVKLTNGNYIQTQKIIKN